jgi:sarcosine oxidase
VVVVGQGAVAGAAAWHLARYGRDVLVLPYPAGEAPTLEATTPLRARGARSLATAAAAESWWREIEAESGASLLGFTDGVDHGDPARTAAVAEELVAFTVPHIWLGTTEAQLRWPGMLFEGPVLLRPNGAGRLRPAQATRSLWAAAVGRGAVVERAARVISVVPTGDDRVRVTTDTDVIRARKAVVAAGVASAAVLSETALPRMRAVSACVAAFRPLTSNPCIPLENNWPIFIHRAGASHSWPADVAGTPDPCGDVIVGFESVDRRPTPAQLRDYVAGALPGLDATEQVMVDRTWVETFDRRPLLAEYGPIVVGAAFAGQGLPLAPVVGGALAKIACSGAAAPEPLSAAG